MNPVFWLLVVLVLVGVWFALRPLFRGIGNSTAKTLDKTKETMFNEDEKETKE